MVILLQINKITFEKSENHISQNLGKILTEKFFLWFFLNCNGGNSI